MSTSERDLFSAEVAPAFSDVESVPSPAPTRPLSPPVSDTLEAEKARLLFG